MQVEGHHQGTIQSKTTGNRPQGVALAVHELSFAINGLELIHPMRFQIPYGRRVMVLGPNGAGKSLLLRLCHGLLQPTSGTITRNDQHAPGRRAHAMVFQAPVMLRRSVMDNVCHALAAIGVPHDQQNKRAEEALQRFGLMGLGERPARLLSGGEQQRLAIARAWALRPDVLFLDEPTSALDPSATRQIEAMLDELHHEGVTCIMSTHDLGQARRLADDVLFLASGSLIEMADARAFFDTPQTPEAKAFIAGDLLW
jgi:tungstate transport system ATP-binding protein